MTIKKRDARQIDREQGDRCAQGDKRIEELFKRHHNELVGVLRATLKDTELAKDIAQQAFENFLRVDAREEVREPSGLLYHMAWRLVTNHRRYKGTREKYKLEVNRRLYASNEALHLVSPEDTVLHDERLRILEKVILQLPRKRREVMILCFVRGMTSREIAALKGVSLDSVRRLRRLGIADCRNRMARILRKKGG